MSTSPTGAPPPTDDNEFDDLAATAADLGLPASAVVPVRRVGTEVDDGRTVSALEWGADPVPSLAFLHGGGQNGRTWDGVALALGRPALAIDLPGHGRSSWRPDRDYTPQRNAVAVADVLRQRSTPPVVVVGMSLGGLTSISLAAQFPGLVRAMVIVDVTPQSPARVKALSTEQRGTVALVSGPRTYLTFDQMADAAIRQSPRRAPEAVRRGVRHNARQLDDGRWTWRYDEIGRSSSGAEPDYRVGWDEFGASSAPAVLVQGGESGFVHPDDAAEMQRRRPGLPIVVIAGAGHSVQSDQPLALVKVIAEFVDAHPLPAAP